MERTIKQSEQCTSRSEVVTECSEVPFSLAWHGSLVRTGMADTQISFQEAMSGAVCSCTLFFSLYPFAAANNWMMPSWMHAHGRRTPKLAGAGDLRLRSSLSVDDIYTWWTSALIGATSICVAYLRLGDLGLASTPHTSWRFEIVLSVRTEVICVAPRRFWIRMPSR